MEFWQIAERLQVIGASQITTTGEVVKATDAFCRLIGVDSVAIQGRSVVDLTSSKDRYETEKRLQALASGEVGSVSVYKRYIKPSGEKQLALLESVAIRDPDSNETLYLLSIAVPCDESGEDEKVIELEKALGELRVLFSAINQGVNINMVNDGSQVNADRGASVAIGNVSNSSKVIVAGMVSAALVAVCLIVLALGGYFRMDADSVEINRPQNEQRASEARED